MTGRSWDVLTLSKTLWGEARGEGYKGMLAVAHVIRNRAASPGRDWWGDTITEVCLKPRQFSCWNTDDPNRDLLDNVTLEDREYLIAHGVAALVLAGELDDPTGGATHYLRSDILNRVRWDDSMVETARIGHHVFFRERG